jgi:hypothetical protein
MAGRSGTFAERRLAGRLAARSDRQEPGPSPSVLLVGLQRTIGNAGVTRLIAERAPAGALQRCPGCGGTCGCEEEDEEKLLELGQLLRTRKSGAGLLRLVDPFEPAGFGTPVGTHPTLRTGSKGPAVAELQTKLNQVDAAEPPLVPDADFGPLTRQAVQAFQGVRDLVPDGIAGPLTWGALDAGTTGGGPASPIGKNAPKRQASTDDVDDEQECDALPASQVGGAVNEILAWQTSADDAQLVNRLAQMICFPRQYLIFVPAVAVGLIPPLPGTPQRQAMLIQMAQALGDFTFGLDTAKGPVATAFGLPQLSEERAKKVQDRIDALIGVALAPSGAQISAKRLAAASSAAGEVGKVDHKLLDGGRRYGADRLLEYFNVAFGGSVPATQVQTINNPPADIRDRLSCTKAPEPCDQLAPWCGIFASWALQTAGIALPAWSLQDGKGVNQRGNWRQLGTQPGDEIQPGDLATRTTGNHQALVSAVTPSGAELDIETVEGNTSLGGGTGIEAALGGKIVHKSYHGKGLTFPAWDTGFFRPPGAD